MVKYYPVLTLNTMTGSVAMKEQGSLSMCVVHITIKGHVDIPGLGYCLTPCLCRKVVQNWPYLTASVEVTSPLAVLALREYALHLT